MEDPDDYESYFKNYFDEKEEYWKERFAEDNKDMEEVYVVHGGKKRTK